MKRLLWSWLAWPSDAWTPTQVSLAAGSSADSTVLITWLTDDDRDDLASCSQVAVAEVRGPIDSAQPSVHSLQVVGTCSRYSLGSAPGLFGNYTSGRIHRVQVNGLVAGSKYAYTLHGDLPATARSFKTLPASGKPNSPSDHDFPSLSV